MHSRCIASGHGMPCCVHYLEHLKHFACFFCLWGKRFCHLC